VVKKSLISAGMDSFPADGLCLTVADCSTPFALYREREEGVGDTVDSVDDDDSERSDESDRWPCVGLGDRSFDTCNVRSWEERISDDGLLEMRGYALALRYPLRTARRVQSLENGMATSLVKTLCRC
jgi:hypothetical protein